MISIEQAVKNQFARYFKKDDWQIFKIVADYYLQKAATLKKADMHIDEVFQLLLRNIQKRLFLGIAGELLLKASYLKNGFLINKPVDAHAPALNPLGSILVADLKKDDTYTFNHLLGSLHNVTTLENFPTIQKGFRILKTFRNKEGHVVLLNHRYVAQNYRDIESALIEFYRQIFGETLTLFIAMEKNDKGKFSVIPVE